MYISLNHPGHLEFCG